jgi:indole-3-glycerol phosphate synthase
LQLADVGSVTFARRLADGSIQSVETAEDMNRLRAAGFHAFLIGESLMRRPDPGKALENLLLGAPVIK